MEGRLRQGLGWGEEMSAQGLGGPQMVRWQQRIGPEDTVLWAAREKEQLASFSWTNCVVVVMGLRGTCHRGNPGIPESPCHGDLPVCGSAPVSCGHKAKQRAGALSGGSQRATWGLSPLSP